MVDLCTVDSGETVLHHIGSERTLINTGQKSLLHYCDGDSHVLADAMMYHQSPLALGSTCLFALAMDSAHVHVYLKPQVGMLSWRMVQNIAVVDAGILWSDGGALALLSKGPQLYFLQPIRAADKQRDALLMFSVKSKYLAPNPAAPTHLLWSREEAAKAVTHHVQSLLAHRTHPFAMMIHGFVELFAKQAHTLLHAATPAAATNTSSTAAPSVHAFSSVVFGSSSSSSRPSSRLGSRSGSVSAPRAVLSPAQRGELVHLVVDFQSMVELHMRVMWSDCCGTPRQVKAPLPPADTNTHKRRPSQVAESSPSPEPPPPNFLPECSTLFDDSLFRALHPALFPLYTAACAADDAAFENACGLHLEQHATPETFGSSILKKSPWLAKRNKTTAHSLPPSSSSSAAAAHRSKNGQRAKQGISSRAMPFLSVPASASSSSSSFLSEGVEEEEDEAPRGRPSSVSFSQPHSPLHAVSFHPLSPHPLLAKALERTSAAAAAAASASALASGSLLQSYEETEAADWEPLVVGSEPASSSSSALGLVDHDAPTWPAAATPHIASTLVMATLLDDCFRPSISLLKMLPLLYSPRAKLRLLSKLHQQLLADAQKIYDPSPVGAKLFTMSADDLVPILCFVLVQARLTRPHADAEMLMDFLGEEAALGEDGYMVTTLQIALAQITQRDRAPSGPGSHTPERDHAAHSSQGGAAVAASGASSLQSGSILSSLTQGTYASAVFNGLVTPGATPQTLSPPHQPPPSQSDSSSSMLLRVEPRTGGAHSSDSSPSLAAVTSPALREAFNTNYFSSSPTAPAEAPASPPRSTGAGTNIFNPSRISQHFMRAAASHSGGGGAGSVASSPSATGMGMGMGPSSLRLFDADSASSPALGVFARPLLSRSESGLLLASTGALASSSPHAGIGHALLASAANLNQPRRSDDLAASSTPTPTVLAPSLSHPLAASSISVASPASSSDGGGSDAEPPPADWCLSQDSCTGRRVMVMELKSLPAPQPSPPLDNNGATNSSNTPAVHSPTTSLAA